MTYPGGDPRPALAPSETEPLAAAQAVGRTSGLHRIVEPSMPAVSATTAGVVAVSTLVAAVPVVAAMITAAG